jgi:hypothetical protein
MHLKYGPLIYLTKSAKRVGFALESTSYGYCKYRPIYRRKRLVDAIRQ